MRGEYTSGTARSRLTSFVTACMAADIPWRRCAIIGSLSLPEVGACILADRSQTLSLVQPVDCFPNRPVVALERGSTRLGTSLIKSWTSDDELMTMLDSHGWLDKDKKHVTGDANTLDSPQNGKPNDALIYIFEWLIDKRKSAAIAAYAIGPTQMFLEYSPIAGGKRQERFPTWEDLWEFWTCTDAGLLAGKKALTYLPLKQDYPTPSSSDETIQTYLEDNQVGHEKDGSPRDWAGKWANYLNSFKTGLAITWEIGQSLGYPNLK